MSSRTCERALPPPSLSIPFPCFSCFVYLLHRESAHNDYSTLFVVYRSTQARKQARSEPLSATAAATATAAPAAFPPAAGSVCCLTFVIAWHGHRRYTSPELNAATTKLIYNARKNGKILGLFLFGTDRVKEFMDKGFTFISVGNGALQQNPTKPDRAGHPALAATQLQAPRSSRHHAALAPPQRPPA